MKCDSSLFTQARNMFVIFRVPMGLRNEKNASFEAEMKIMPFCEITPAPQPHTELLRACPALSPSPYTRQSTLVILFNRC